MTLLFVALFASRAPISLAADSSDVLGGTAGMVVAHWTLVLVISLLPPEVDPSQDGAEIVNGVADRVRAEMFRRIGLEDLLSPRVGRQSDSGADSARSYA